MAIMSTNFAWKHEYDVKLRRHKKCTPNTNDHHMPLNETPSRHENFLRTPLVSATMFWSCVYAKLRYAASVPTVHVFYKLPVRPMQSLNTTCRWKPCYVPLQTFQKRCHSMIVTVFVLQFIKAEILTVIQSQTWQFYSKHVVFEKKFLKGVLLENTFSFWNHLLLWTFFSKMKHCKGKHRGQLWDSSAAKNLFRRGQTVTSLVTGVFLTVGKLI